MAASTLAQSRSNPPGAFDTGASALLASVPSGHKNIVGVLTLPFGANGTSQMQVPVVYTTTLPAYGDYSAYPVGTIILCFDDAGAGVTGLRNIYFKIANAGAAADIKMITFAAAA